MSTQLDVFGPQLPAPLVKANWLGRYLAVEKQFDEDLFKVLKEAEKDIARRLAKVEAGEDISSRIRATQLRLAQKSVRDYVDSLFGKVGNLIKGYQKDAAEAAIDASLYDQRGLLSMLFSNPVDRQNYADSLRQTARRNVESTITRVLQTEMPLSQRVWKSKALANGMVSRAINNGLARGDSADDIARAVHNFIKPETPGGISYAAKRLGRTEINNAFHAQSIQDAQEKPWITQMEWNLSKRHESDPGDLCESYALMGYFDVERVPKKPHPNCRCFVISVLPDYQSFEDNLVSGRYDSYIDEVMGKGFANEQVHEQVVAPTNLPRAQPVSQEELEIQRYGRSLSDIDSSPNIQAVAGALERKHPGMKVLQFNEENCILESAKEYAHAVDDMMNKYPDIKIDVVAFQKLMSDDVYARTLSRPGYVAIEFNSTYGRNPKLCLEKTRVNVLNGFHPVGTEKRPIYWHTVHEFGHVVDHYGEWSSSKGALNAIWNFYSSAVEPEPPGIIYDLATGKNIYNLEKGKWLVRVRKWLKGSNWPKLPFNGEAPSGYAFNYTGDFNDEEALAEAFLDVEMNGNEAKPLSLLLDFILRESYSKVTGKEL